MEKKSVSLELTVTNNQIVCNSAEYVEAVRSIMPKFDYIVDEENIDVAKADMKQINKFVKDASRKRIDTENELLKDWLPHKEVLMEVEKELKVYKAKLENQVKAIEDGDKEEEPILETTFYLSGTQSDFNALLKYINEKTQIKVKSFKTKEEK